MLITTNSKSFRFFSQNFGIGSFIRFSLVFVFFFGVLVLSNSPVLAQGPVNGSFVGRVIDSVSNLPIPNATVIFRNIDRGFQTAAKSDSNGQFSRTALPPGNYEIEANADGYKSKIQKQSLYATRSNDVVPVPFSLEKAAAGNTQPVTTPTPTTGATSDNSKVEVSDTDANINLNPRRDGAFNQDFVTNLPLGGTTLTRSFDELAFLIPGVNPAPQAIGSSVGPGVGGGVGTSGQFSVNGLRSRANNFTVDGSDNNDEDIGVRRQGFFTLVPQPIESIQEFSIITLLAPAQFGRNMGAQVNALSKSGGNRFSGSIFGLFNSDKLNASNFFDNTSGDSSFLLTAQQGSNSIPVLVDGTQPRITNDAGEKDSLTLLQGGFAVGGRIVRDKLFFFASGEGQWLNGTKEVNFAVPTVEQRGLFGSGASGLQQCRGAGGFVNGACRDAAGNPTNFTPGFPTSVGGDEVFSLFPFANNPSGVYGRNTYTQALSTDARGRILSGKIDWDVFEVNGYQQTLTARYNYTDDKRDLTDVGGALFSAIRPTVRTDNFSTYLSGGLTDNLSNEFRVSWGRTRLRFEELPDTTGFLLPLSNALVTNAAEKRFLLNTRRLLNNSLPSGCTPTGCPAVSQVQYSTSGTTEFGTNSFRSSLGPIGQLIIAGFSPVGVDVFNFPQDRINQTYQFADTLRWQIGNHSLSLGADIRRTVLESNLPRNARPLVTFNGSRRSSISSPFALPLDLAASGAATGFFQTLVLPGKDASINLGYYQFNFFAQDEWRAGSKANISFGLRYEYNTPPKEADNKIESTFGIQQTLPFLSGLNQFIAGRTKIFDADRNNLAPRFGVAVALTPKTVLRSGLGIYYDQILGAVVSQSRNVFPTFTTLNFGGGINRSGSVLNFSLFNPINSVIILTPGPTVPVLTPGSLNTLNPFWVSNSAPNTTFLQTIYNTFPLLFPGTPYGATLPTRKMDTPFSFQYSISLEQELKSNTFLSVAFVTTKGEKLLRFTTPNAGANFVATITNFTLSSNQPLVQGTTADPVRPVSSIGPISQFESTGRSQYSALQIELRGRLLNQKLQYRVNYALGDVKDDVSDVFDLAGASALPQNSNTFSGEYAPANFDVRHRFTYSFVYDLPQLKDQSSIAKFFFGSWQVAGTGRYNTGQPFTVNSIFDVNLDGNLTDRLNSTQFITETGNRQQPLTSSCGACSVLLAPFGQDGQVSRNSFRAGSVLDLDLSFSKRFKIVENQNLQFRVDIFNFINRANFGIPVRFLESPGFGQATDTVTPGRRIQFVVRYNF